MTKQDKNFAILIVRTVQCSYVLNHRGGQFRLFICPFSLQIIYLVLPYFLQQQKTTDRYLTLFSDRWP